MGCPDSIIVNCPFCGAQQEFQTKGGACTLTSYTLEEAPDDVFSDVNRHAPVECKCGELLVVIGTEDCSERSVAGWKDLKGLEPLKIGYLGLQIAEDA